MEEDAIKQLMTLDGVGKAKAKLLYDAGYETIGSIQKADLGEISAIKGIGEKLAEKIKKSAGDIEPELEEKTVDIIESPEILIKMDDETKRLLDVRKYQKSKKPHFLQTDSHKKKKLEDKWKRPDGIHNKTRYSQKGKCPRVERGFGSPALVRGLHPSGFIEVVINNLKELESLNVERMAGRIAHTVGARKRYQIEKKAAELGLKILNPTRREE
jgi:large subunit ribosomal protein L32e